MIESEAAMDFELSKEQQEIKDRAAAFVEEACRPLEQSWGNDDYAVTAPEAAAGRAGAGEP
jgi:hypothetical protein